MRVNTDELERQAMEIRRLAVRLHNIESSVSRISRILNLEQFGERFRIPLIRAAESIIGRSDELSKMSALLCQISQLYEKAETGIVDEAEHANVHFEHHLSGIIKFPEWIIRPIGPHPGPCPGPIRPVIPEDIWETTEIPNNISDIIQPLGPLPEVAPIMVPTDDTPEPVCPPLPDITERSDHTLDELEPNWWGLPNTSILDHVPSHVMPGPAPDVIGYERALRELFENLPDGMDIFGEQAADSSLIGSGESGLIDWTPWEA